MSQPFHPAHSNGFQSTGLRQWLSLCDLSPVLTHIYITIESIAYVYHLVLRAHQQLVFRLSHNPV
jgi:hypothetical protein